MFVKPLTNLALVAPLTFYYAYGTKNQFARYGMYALGAAIAGEALYSLYQATRTAPVTQIGAVRTFDVKPAKIVATGELMR